MAEFDYLVVGGPTVGCIVGVYLRLGTLGQEFTYLSRRNFGLTR